MKENELTKLNDAAAAVAVVAAFDILSYLMNYLLHLVMLLLKYYESVDGQQVQILEQKQMRRRMKTMKKQKDCVMLY